MFDPATGKLMVAKKPQQTQRHAHVPGDSLMFDPATGKLMVKPR